MDTRRKQTVELRAFRRQQGAERGQPHWGGSGAVTERLAPHVAPSMPCTVVHCGRRAQGKPGSRAARDPPPVGRFAQPTISWWVRGSHRVTGRPRSAERGPHGSGGHEADAGSQAARGLLPATGRRCACTLPQRRAKRSPLLVAELGVSIEPALPPHTEPDRGGVHGLQCGPLCIWRASGEGGQLSCVRSAVGWELGATCLIGEGVKRSPMDLL